VSLSYTFHIWKSIHNFIISSQNYTFTEFIASNLPCLPRRGKADWMRHSLNYFFDELVNWYLVVVIRRRSRMCDNVKSFWWRPSSRYTWSTAPLGTSPPGDCVSTYNSASSCTYSHLTVQRTLSKYNVYKLVSLRAGVVMSVLQNGWTDRDPVWTEDSWVQRNVALDRGPALPTARGRGGDWMRQSPDYFGHLFYNRLLGHACRDIISASKYILVDAAIENPRLNLPCIRRNTRQFYALQSIVA